MQSTYLITAKQYTEEQVGIMFFAFGISQFLFQTPAGYLMDYLASHKKIIILGLSAITTTILTLATAAFATNNGGNLHFMILIKFLQGALTALIPTGLNSITLGIVGIDGITDQVSQNEKLHHLGTALFVIIASLLAFAINPRIEFLFIVSPLGCIGLLYHLRKLRREQIDHNAARGFSSSRDAVSSISSSGSSSKGHRSTSSSINSTSIRTSLLEASASIHVPSSSSSSHEDDIRFRPSFNFGFIQSAATTKSMSFDAANTNTNITMTTTPKHNSHHHPPSTSTILKANTPLQIIKKSTMITFVTICFTFHLSNGTVLPLVMQTLAIGNGRFGLLLSGLCIAIAQIFMEISADICGKYSSLHGRKTLFIIGIVTVPIRCTLLTLFLSMKEDIPWILHHVFILSTQVLDGVGAGIFSTMYVLVTSDISIGSGRFSLTLGLTTAAVSLGGTISGYFGQVLAEDRGYREAFLILAFVSLVPACIYYLCMPETLPGNKTGTEGTTCNDAFGVIVVGDKTGITTTSSSSSSSSRDDFVLIGKVEGVTVDGDAAGYNQIT